MKINRSFKLNPEIIKKVDNNPGEFDFITSPVKNKASPRNNHINSLPGLYSPLFALAMI